MVTTCGAGITAAAGTGLAHHLFAKLFRLGKSLPYDRHVGSPHHACAHCGGFASAAPRRARTLFSVSFSGLRLSSPLQIFGLVVRYTTNSLICRQLILGRRSFQRQAFPSFCLLWGISLSFPRLSPALGQIVDVLLSLAPPPTRSSRLA